MAYIGNTVQNQGFAPAIDYFNGDGTTVTFTLSRPIASVAQVICAIDNVIQNPSSAFTVTGNSITFTSAPLSGTNNIWVEYTSLITTYAAISQDPSVIGDITASGGYLSTGDFGNTFTDGTIVDYVTGNARITTGPADGITLYNGGTTGRTALAAWDTSGNLTNTGNVLTTGSVGAGTTSPASKLDIYTSTFGGAQRPITISSTNSAGSKINYAGIGYTCDQGSAGIESGSLNLYTYGSGSLTSKVTIDSTGRVNMPYQTSFLAYGSKTTTAGTWQVVSDGYTTTSYNVGSAYNASNGRFTAPISGKYVFYAGGYTPTAGNGERYAFCATVNGGSQTFIAGGQLSLVDTPLVGYCVTLSLSAADYVDLRMYTANAMALGTGAHTAYFGGYLLG